MPGGKEYMFKVDTVPVANLGFRCRISCGDAKLLADRAFDFQARLIYLSTAAGNTFSYPSRRK
jgi:hypothetical protein